MATFIMACLPFAASAQRDPGFEAGLSVVASGDERAQVQEAPGFGRNTVVKRDTRTRKLVGASLAIAGGVSLVGAWATYVARQNYRLRTRHSLPADEVSAWESQGAWAFWLGMGGAAALVGSEYVLLPEEKDVPTLAWLAGLAGLVTGAVGAGYVVGGTQCAPLAIRPGAVIPKACLSGTADDVFGFLLLQTSLPLLNLPLAYLLRSAFAREPEPLTLEVGPGSLRVRGTF